MDKTDKSLVRKLAEVMAEVGRVPKRGRNEFHHYDYATEADIAEAVRAGLASRRVMMIPSVESLSFRELDTKGGGKQTVATVSVRYRVYDGDSGESLDIGPICGEGQDAGDKATYKALTGATKYALLKTFLIPTGDDPEAETAAPSSHPPAHERARREPGDDDMPAMRGDSTDDVLVANVMALLPTMGEGFAQTVRDVADKFHKYGKLTDGQRAMFAKAMARANRQ